LRNAVPAAVPVAPRLLDLGGAAAYLAVSPWTVRDLEAAGTLKRVRVPTGGGKLLFDRADLDRLVEAWKV
jgi:excisionase family DNA binding protein